MQIYTQEFKVRWSDLDPNFHMKHTSYADLCATTRFLFLEEKGFGMKVMQKHGVGPVLLHEDLKYFKEIFANDQVQVNLKISGLSDDMRKWQIDHEVYRGDGKKSALVRVMGVWFDLKNRKVTEPPEDVKSLFQEIPKTEDFTKL